MKKHPYPRRSTVRQCCEYLMTFTYTFAFAESKLPKGLYKYFHHHAKREKDFRKLSHSHLELETIEKNSGWDEFVGLVAKI